MGTQESDDEINERPASGAEIIEWLRSPSSVEKRSEMVLHMGQAIGLDDAKRVIDRLRIKELAIYSLFEHDMITPLARVFLDQFLGHWMAGIEDWGDLTQMHAESRGMTVEELGNERLHKERMRRHTNASDTGQVPPHNRLGSHLLDMDDLGGLDGNNELTNTYFQYDRFQIIGDEDGEEKDNEG